MKMITVSAPGKLMLLGEYAVLYNRPCLVTTIDKRLYATVELIDKNEFQLEAKDVGISEYRKPMKKVGKGNIPKGARFVEVAVRDTLRHSGKSVIRRTHPESLSNVRDSGAASLPGVRVTTKSEFPSKFGFGSSSAATVCIVKAMSELFGLGISNREIFDISHKTILDVQGKGSGFDVAAAVYGGTLYFLTAGKVIEPLNIKEIPLVVGYTGRKADTVRLMNKVKRGFSNRKNRLEEIYDGIKTLVNQGKEALVKMDWNRFGDLMNRNQKYLQELGVSTSELDRMVRLVVTAGAYGAKLSGAGRGDCMIAIVSDEKRRKVEQAIQKAGGEIISVGANAEGVRIE